MLNLKVTELARNMIQVQFDERRKQLRQDIMRVKNEIAIRGMLRSSMTLSRICDLYINEIQIRASIVLKVFIRILSTEVYPSEELASDLKSEMEKYLFDILSELNKDLHKTVGSIKSVVTDEQVDKLLDSAYGHALKKIGTEIELFVLSLSRAKEREGQSGSSQAIYNFYSPVGAVQTGPGATATVTQNLNSENREALLYALDDIKKYLESEENLDFPKEEILELVDESCVELKKPNPNGMRLRAVLTTVAITIQTVGSLQQAYQVVKSALSLFGVYLPW